MKIEANRKILLLAIVLALLSPLPANAECGDGSFSDFKLTADDPVTKAQFGHSVAVSGDTMVVGTFDESAAYVFEYDGSNWRQEAKLTTDIIYFGYSVAISGDTVAVGSPFTSSVYVFKREGDSWAGDSWDESDPEDNDYSPLILEPSVSTPLFGWSLAFDGSTLVVGPAMANSVYVYNLDGDNWPEEEAKLTVNSEVTDRFGWSVAVSGNRVVVGAPWDNVQDPDDPGGTITLKLAGSAYVFEFDGDTWLGNDPTELKREDAAEDDLFGFSVAINDNTVVVGAHKDNWKDVSNPGKDVSNPGKVYVFNPDGANWPEEEARLTPSDSADYDEFGYSVAINDSILLVGAPIYDTSDPDQGPNAPGAAYVFELNESGKWLETEKLTASDAGDPPEKDQFGWSVDIGSAIVVGAPLSNLEVPDQTDVDLNNEVLKAGAAYVFTANDEAPVSVVQSTLGSSRHRFFPAWEIFEFTATQGDKATLIFEADANGSNNHGKGVSVFVRDKIRGERFFRKNRWALGTPMQMEFRADGEYRVYVFGHPWYFRSKGFRGDYTLKLEGICAELTKVSRRNKWK